MIFRNIFFLVTMMFVVVQCKTDSRNNGNQSGIISKIILVRHAEKSSGDDPVLTMAGEERAKRFAALLKDADVQYIFSTNYNRTKATSEPLAVQTKHKVEIYDPADLPAFSRQLKSLPKGSTAVVVGHSNTTPVMVNLLDGTKDYPQIDESNYENIYVVSIYEQGNIESNQLTFSNFSQQFSIK